MSAKRIAELITKALQEQHIRARVTFKEGTWVHPAHIEFQYNGEGHIFPFWVGGDDEQMAKAIFADIMRVIEGLNGRDYGRNHA